MKIEQQTVIRGKMDYCNVIVEPNGVIRLGSIALENTDELVEFGIKLQQLGQQKLELITEDELPAQSF